MAKIVLGGKELDHDCEEIDLEACWVPDCDVAALGKMLAGGEFARVKELYLVSCAAYCVNRLC